MTKISPTETRVLVKRTDADSKSKGGIIIPESYKRKSTEGTIIEIGPEVLHLAKDQKVIFPMYAGSDIEVDDKEYVILLEEEILATIKEI
jgi:chaperonin GroES